MRSFSLSLLTLSLSAAGLLSLSACSEESGPDPFVVPTGGTTATGGAVATGGATATGGAVTTGGDTATGGAGTGGGTPSTGIPLTFADGWVDGASNTALIQGAVFTYADLHTETTAVETIEGATACFAGEAFQVDLDCEITDPNASDCYGEFWGAAIGFNLNQGIDEVTMEGTDPMPYDAAAAGIRGFSFDLSGNTVPTSMRFTVETSTGEFCTRSATPVLLGSNEFTFEDLFTTCWNNSGDPLTDTTSILKIAWQVVTNDSSTTPFDYCVSNVVALQ